MKELTKLVKLILVPLSANEIREVVVDHWLLTSSKSLNEKGEHRLHVPAAGGEYRRLIASGNYVAVKPYLICDDKIKEGDMFVWANNGVVENGYTLEEAKKLGSTDILNTNYKIQHKVIATPEQIFGSQIIMFNEGVKENFDHRAMGIILNMNGGGCKIQAEFVVGTITENPDEILTEIKADKLTPKLENGKVIIVI